jgi:hypothetical protein
MDLEMKEFDIVRRETTECVLRVRATNLNEAMAFARRNEMSPADGAPGVIDVGERKVFGNAGYHHIKNP